MAALNYQTEDIAMQLNTAMFEMNGKCGFVSKPHVMWDRSHVMYRRYFLINFSSKRFGKQHFFHLDSTLGTKNLMVSTPASTSSI